MLRQHKLLHSFKTGILKLTKVTLVWIDFLTKYKYRKRYMSGDREQEMKREGMKVRWWTIATQHASHG